MPTRTLVDDVRHEIARFVSGQTDLWDLDAWLNPRTLGLPHDDPSFALSREVFLFFAEVTSGHRTEDEVRDALRPVVGDSSVSADDILTTRLAG